MKFVFRISIVLIVLALSFGINSAQSPEDQSATSFLMNYINRLNTGDYANAYAMIDNREDSYEEFVAGYEHTVRIVPYFGFMGAAAGSTYVTTILLGYQDDGSIETYYGYFQLHSGELYTPIRNNGGPVLGSARFQLLSDDWVLSNYSIDTLLDTAWDETVDVSDELMQVAHANSESIVVLMNYYDLISAENYAPAYNTWLSLEYLEPYDTWVAGFADTTYVTVYGSTNQGIATTRYFYTPVVLVAEHDDGSFETYSGCFVMGRFSAGNLGIVNGSFSLLMDDVPDSASIFETLDTLNCANLRIPY